MDDQEYLAYADKIVGEAQKQGVILRLLGSVAFFIHCPVYGSFQQQANRRFTDLDFAAYYKESDHIRHLFESLQFEENRETAVVYARSRLVLDHPHSGLHVDIFFDKLDFCHPILWKDRLELDTPTLPLAELLLEKMQIVEINEKDIIDTLMLLREHPIGENDNETINSRHIAAICARDWGMWRTCTMNLKKVINLSSSYSWISNGDGMIISERINHLLNIIEKEPKGLSWKFRNKIGDRVKWYKDVSEVSQ